MRLHAAMAPPFAISIFTAILIAVLCAPLVPATLLGIDLGAEWLKVSAVRAGAPLDILLNAESKRKTPASVVIRDGYVYAGSSSTVQSTKFPADSFRFAKNLIGRTAHSNEVAHYSDTYSVKLAPNPGRGDLVDFVGSDDQRWSVEEIIALQLRHIVRDAERFDEPVSGAVITVPPYFGVLEREVVLSACRLADIPPLALISDGAAVALNYASTHKYFPKPEHYIFYDAGSTGTTVSLIRFVQSADQQAQTAANPSMLNVDIDVIGVAFNATFGGHLFDLAVRDILLETIKEKRGEQLTTEIMSTPRAMAKLLKESVRVKQILSANTECQTSVEGLLPDFDFKANVKRSQLEDRVSHNLDNIVSEPIKKVLADAGKTMDDVKSVVLVGGHGRVPIVYRAIEDFVGAERIAKNINADEAAALGSGLYAAAVRGYRVGNVKLRDANTISVKVQYPTTLPINESAPIGTFGAVNNSLLFGLPDNSPLVSTVGELGTRRILVTNLTKADTGVLTDTPASFSIPFHAEVKALSEQSELTSVSEINVRISNLYDALTRVRSKMGFKVDAVVPSNGVLLDGDFICYIKTYITLTKDGVPEVTSTLFGRNLVKPKTTKEETDAESKGKSGGVIKNLLGKMFGSGDDTGEKTENQDQDEDDATTTETDIPEKTITETEPTVASDEAAADPETETKNTTVSSTTSTTSTTTTSTFTYPTHAKHTLAVNLEYQDRKPLELHEFYISSDRLHAITLMELRRQHRADRLNTLETLFYSIDNLLEDESIKKHVDIENFQVTMYPFVYKDPFEHLERKRPKPPIIKLAGDKDKKNEDKEEKKEEEISDITRAFLEIVSSFRDYMDSGKHYNADIKEIGEQLHHIEAAMEALKKAKQDAISDLERAKSATEALKNAQTVPSPAANDTDRENEEL